MGYSRVGYPVHVRVRRYLYEYQDGIGIEALSSTKDLTFQHISAIHA